MSSEKSGSLKFLVLLAFATPGIPEYLSGSWRISTLFSNPLNFLFFLVMNLGLYTTGALMIREFIVTFRKGWVSVFILGIAYGIMEEAIALHTFFQVSGSPVGILGYYGRFAGVDWVWAFGLMIYHAVFSITIPILFISLAFPRMNGRRATGNAGILSAFLIYVVTVFILNYVINHASSRPVPTTADYTMFILMSAALVAVAYIVPGNLLSFRGRERRNLFVFYVLGLLIYPIYNVFAYVPVNPAVITRISPFLDIFLHLVLFGALAAAIVHFMPPSHNGREKFALAAGGLTSLMIVSVRMELERTAPYIAIILIIAAIFLYRLWTTLNESDQGRGFDSPQADQEI